MAIRVERLLTALHGSSITLRMVAWNPRSTDAIEKDCASEYKEDKGGSESGYLYF